MTPSPSGPALPEAITGAARLRRDGRLQEALTLVHESLLEARATPFDTPFRDRVLLALTLADLHLMADQAESARTLLDTEAAFAEKVLRLTKETGSPDQVHAATAGCFQIRDRATQVALLGNPAPEIDVADWVMGEPTTLAEQRGRAVMVAFWATWCHSCTSMFPFFGDLHRRYTNDGLTMLAITNYRSSSENHAERVSERASVRQAVADHGVEFAVGVAPDESLRQKYGANGMPTFALIDRSGIVRLASSKPDKTALDQTVVGLLNNSIDICS